jgi:Zn-dependent peptidase ImmA (M78 family)
MRWAQAHGIKVTTAPLEEIVPGYLILDKRILVVNASHTAARQRLSIAHLLGHYFLHHDEARVFVDYTSSAGSLESNFNYLQLEKDANTFALELLMPAEVMRDRFAENPPDAFSEQTPRHEAALFGTSEVALALRLGELGLANV